jgi:membrane protease YdiL (CAAX protease family)
MEQFQRVIDQGYSFDLGKYLDEGWAILKKSLGNFIGYTVIFLAITVVLSLIPFINILGQFVQYALIAGAYIFIRNLLHRREEFGDFFSGFNQFGQIFLFGLVFFAFFIPLLLLLFGVVFPFDILPEILSGSPDGMWVNNRMTEHMEGNPLMIIGFLIFLAGTIFLYTSYSLALPLIADAKLGFWQAMETSRKVVAKKFFHFLLFHIVIVLIVAIGSIATCGLGLLLALPFMWTTTFAMYDSILKPESNTLADDISTFGARPTDINTESDENRI